MSTAKAPAAPSGRICKKYSGTLLLRPPHFYQKWPFKRGGLSSESNTFMFRFTVSSSLSRGVGLKSGWPLKRGSTVLLMLENRVPHSWIFNSL